MPSLAGGRANRNEVCNKSLDKQNNNIEVYCTKWPDNLSLTSILWTDKRSTFFWNALMVRWTLMCDAISSDGLGPAQILDKFICNQIENPLQLFPCSTIPTSSNGFSQTICYAFSSVSFSDSQTLFISPTVAYDFRFFRLLHNKQRSVSVSWRASPNQSREDRSPATIPIQ